MNRKEIKERAKNFAFQNKWNIWKPLLITFGISFIVGLILRILGYGPEWVYIGVDANGFPLYELVSHPVYEIVTGILAIAILPIGIGTTYYVMNLIRGNNMDIKEIFSKYKYYIPILIVVALIFVFTFLWSLLLIIPGIIYALKVSMSGFIMADELDENTKPMEVLDKSKSMMEGHKWEYFVFNLSFIGWFLLIPITLGIVLIWLIPYIQTANIMYYEKLKELN